ncbi:hypothetical protein [Methylocella sp.]|uniref:hypothetical protein n=1 Tax=Methylocella sp. TaxID=1978226 RepID=UPI0037848D40
MLPLPSSLAVLAASYSVHRTRKTLQIEEIAARLAALRDKLTSQSPAQTRRARLRPFAVTRADFDPNANRGRV